MAAGSLISSAALGLFQHADLGIGWRKKVRALQIPQGAPELAVADRIPTGKQCRERRQERRLFICPDGLAAWVMAAPACR
jgi:hypothetical protein